MVSAYRQLIGGTTVNGIGLAVLVVVNFFLIPMQVSVLGLEEFGLVVVGTLFSLQGFISILDLGVPGALTRQIARFRKDEQCQLIRTLYSACIYLFLFLGCFVGLVLFILSEELGSYFAKGLEGKRELLVFGLKAVFVSYAWQFPLLIVKAQFLGYARFKTVQLVTVATELVRFLMIVGLLKYNYGFEAIIVCNASVPMLSLVGFLAISPNGINLPYYSESKQSLKGIWRLSKLLFLGRLSGVFFNNSDKAVASVFLGPVAVGLIEIFTKIPALLNRFLGLSVSAIIPVVAGIDWKNDKRKITNIYHYGFKLYFFFVSFPILLLMYYTPEILLFWVQQSDQAVIDCMRLMLLWSIFIPLQFGGNLLIGLDRGVKQLTKYRVMQSVIKVGTLLVLVGFFNSYAIPLSYLLSVLATIYLLKIFKEYLEVSLRRQIKDHLVLVVAGSLPFIGSHYLFGDYDVKTASELLVEMVLVAILQVLTICIIGLSKEERRAVVTFIDRKLRNSTKS
jgi:O-antigen/teichoic acid export membrane protein